MYTCYRSLFVIYLISTNVQFFIIIFINTVVFFKFYLVFYVILYISYIIFFTTVSCFVIVFSVSVSCILFLASKFYHGLINLFNQSIFFWYLHKKWSFAQTDHESTIETSGNQKEQCLENTASRVGLPISALSSIFSQALQRGAENCHAAKSLYYVSARIAAFLPSMLGSIASIAVDTDRPWWFR